VSASTAPQQYPTASQEYPPAESDHGPDPDGLAPLDLTQQPWPGSTEVLGGRQVHLRRTPGPVDATPAVFVHGLGGSASNWTDLAGLLAPRMAGVAVDLPGFGRSEPPSQGVYTVSGSAEVVVALLEQTGPAHLFGNSMGGAVCILVAAKRPDLVCTLTLVSPAVPDLRPDPRRFSDPRMPLAYLPVLGGYFRRQLQSATPQQRAEALIRLCFAVPDLVPEHRIEQAVAEAKERGSQSWAAEALGRSFGALLQSWLTLPGRRSLWVEAAAVSAPTLVVWGAQDRLVSVDRGPRLVSVLQRGRLLVLNRVGHVAQMEQPLTVARAAVAMHRAVQRGEW